MADIVTRLCRDIEMPLEHFVQVCPRLLPRYYTISSSSKVFPRSVHATVSVLEEEKEKEKEKEKGSGDGGGIEKKKANTGLKVFVRII